MQEAHPDESVRKVSVCVLVCVVYLKYGLSYGCENYAQCYHFDWAYECSCVRVSFIRVSAEREGIIREGTLLLSAASYNSELRNDVQ